MTAYTRLRRWSLFTHRNENATAFPWFQRGRRINGLWILGISAVLGLVIFPMDFWYKALFARRPMSKAEVCQREYQCTPFRQTELIDESQLRTLPSLFIGNNIALSAADDDADNTTTTTATYDFAICEFHLMDVHNDHFPHTMQQLYRCWSWWRLRRRRGNYETTTTTTTPVLVFPGGALPDNAFLQGFVTALQSRIGLQIWSPRQLRRHRRRWRRRWHQQQKPPPTTAASNKIDNNLVRPRVPNNCLDDINILEMTDPAYYAMLQVDDAAALRDTILGKEQQRHHHCGISSSSNNNNSTGKPRIAIFNRHLSREWLNADTVVELLQPYAAQGEIPIVFMDDKSFIEQVSFFRNVDVLLSPHGAQLTGLPFMPDCGSVLEIFPVGYHFPYFFGSLAQFANLQHGYSTITLTGDWQAEATLVMPHLKERNRARNTQLCPDANIIVDGVLQLIDGWQKCCHAKQRQG